MSLANRQTAHTTPHCWPRAIGLSALLLAVLVGCNEAPLPTAPVLPEEQLAAAIASNLSAVDFEEQDYESLDLEVRENLLFIKGVVNSGSRKQVRQELTAAPGIAAVVLTFVPGSADDEENLALGRMLREAGVTTWLPAQALVASGGTDLFLAGQRRIIERGAAVGVHSWSTGEGEDAPSGGDVPRDDPQHRKYLDYYRDLGIPADFYWFTLQAAPADSMHWMTEAELAQYSIYTELR